jgi:hypothetical protein
VIFAFPACSILFGLLFIWIILPLRERSGWFRGTITRLNRASFFCVIAMLLCVLAIQGASGDVLSSSIPYHALTATKQGDIVQSMLWLRDNTSANAAVMSVGLPEFSFLPYFANRTYGGDLLGGPPSITNYIVSTGLGRPPPGGTPGGVYVALFTLLHNSTARFLRLYESDSNYTLEWNSTTVAVFRFG